MTCEEIRDAFVERLTGSVDAERSSAIDRHLETCAECRAETDRLREMWNELGQLSAPAARGGQQRVARLIDARDRVAPATDVVGTVGRPRLVAFGAMLAAALVVGVALGRGLTTRPGADATVERAGDRPPGQPGTALTAVPNAASSRPVDQYVLLLHGPARRLALTPAQAAADSATEASLVTEYRAWAMGLRDSGSLLMGLKLADAPLTVLASNSARDLSPNTADALGGFFLIQADSAEAFRIARDCPHLRHGGTVEIRKIQPT